MSLNPITGIATGGVFSRIKKSLKWILLGIVLVIGCCFLLWWNEGRAVRTAKGLSQGAGIVLSISGDQVEPGNEGKLVHLSGPVTLSETLKDEDFQITAPHALKLRRKVEMYQWQEKKSTKSEKQLDGKYEQVTAYSYETTWSEKPIDSSVFKKNQEHQNPGSIPHPSKTFQVSQARVKAFRLSDSLMNKLSHWEEFPVPAGIKDILPPEMVSKVKIQGGGIYLGEDPHDPEVGDLRITYQVIQPEIVSLVAVQSGNSFKPFQTRQKTLIEMIRGDEATADQMFEAAQSANRALTWVLRILGFILMAVGFSLIFKPFTAVADIVPFMGSITRMGFRLVSVLLAGMLSLLVMGIAWLAARPMVGLALLGAVTGLLILFVIKFSQSKEVNPSPAAG